jgi:hypothetical protein
MKRFEFMNRGAMSALAALGLLAMCSLAGAQTVVITVNPATATANGVPLCASAPVLGMDPAGGLTVTCTPATTGGGTPNTAPSCSNTSNPQPVTIAAGATTYPSISIFSNCTGNPTSYTWSSDVPGFANPGIATATVGPLTAGLYHFSVFASNAVGPSTTVPLTLTVNAPPAGGGTSGCPTTPINAVFTGNGADFPGIVVGGFASYALPQFPAANNSYQLFTAAESNRTFIGLEIEYTVSKCVGDFASMPTQCTKFGTSNSGMSMYAFEGDTATTNGAGVCVMQPNTQYYLNVRTVKADGTNSCTAGTCYLYVYANKYTY